MTESATSLENVMLYYGNIETGELGAHFSFNFQLVNPFSSATDVVNTVQSWFNYMPTQYTANWLVSTIIIIHHHILSVKFRLEITITIEQLQDLERKMWMVIICL